MTHPEKTPQTNHAHNQFRLGNIIKCFNLVLGEGTHTQQASSLLTAKEY